MITEVTLQADLRFLLPLQKDQAVGLAGSSLSIAPSFSQDGIQPVVILTGSEKGALLLQERSLDHIFLPKLHKGQGIRISEFHAALRPGGWFLLGFGNSHGLRRLMFWKHRGSTSHLHMDVEYCRQMLEKLGLEIVNVLGVDVDIDRPKYLVPLMETNVCNFYFREIFMPHSRFGKWIRLFVPLLTMLRWHSILFSDVAIVARKPREVLPHAA